MCESAGVSRTVLVVGGGGREHAIGWALAQDARPPSLLFAPGNPGTASLGENVPIAADDVDRLVRLATERKARLVVVGTRGRTGFARLALGSVAESVVKHAPCSVLGVRALTTPS